jgi:hypothetical protein
VKGTHSTQLVDFVQGNDFEAFEESENIASLFSWDKFNALNLLFPVTDFIKVSIRTCRLHFSL